VILPQQILNLSGKDFKFKLILIKVLLKNYFNKFLILEYVYIRPVLFIEIWQVIRYGQRIRIVSENIFTFEYQKAEGK
jgi:hypothetical protein